MILCWVKRKHWRCRQVDKNSLALAKLVEFSVMLNCSRALPPTTGETLVVKTRRPCTAARFTRTGSTLRFLIFQEFSWYRKCFIVSSMFHHLSAIAWRIPQVLPRRGWQCGKQTDADDPHVPPRSRCGPHGQEHHDEEGHSWSPRTECCAGKVSDSLKLFVVLPRME